jgi:hypoxanthine-guanine phosphoribosyltransferase
MIGVKTPNATMILTTRARQYYEEYKKYQSYKNKYGLIDASKKLFDPKTHSNLDKTYSNLDGLFYCEFYTIGNFGKTRLGNEVFYGKQGPNPELIKNAIKTVKTTIKNYAEQFDAVGFVAPTNDRPIQFMVELEKSLELDLPKINILKVKTPIKVAQKTLKDKSERQENAKATFEVHSDQPYQKVLLIDDLTGSGSTLNELANKIKAQNISDYVVGLTLVGSENGITNTSQKFETISEA